ncbi:DEKNAAC101141 [Brettanomyces naardenensis]|uniref:DEKNAAC101141 n=1 Tax=Brettanomyces naardenensis TaxID=13370 RepID=A0A448YH30_BRENA|nr:DEKNAAC101141 [Brettanomyces naardenensis]
MSSSTLRSAGYVFIGVTAAALSYCIYFDYERRHNPEFRKRINQSKRKAQKKAAIEAEQDKTKKLEVLKKKLNESLVANPLPTSLQEKESYFLEQVTTGEKLGAIPGKEIDAAIYFYKGLAVYPNPTGILDIYQRTLPPKIYELVMMLTAIQPPKSVVNILGDSVGSLDADKTVE